MPATGLNKFIEFLEEKSELIRIGEFVDPELEICEITDRISKQKGGGKEQIGRASCRERV